MRPAHPPLIPAPRNPAPPPCGGDAGKVSLAWHCGLVAAVLSAHALALLAGQYFGAFDKGGNEPVGVLRVHWVDAAHTQPPADPRPSVEPKPLPMKPKPAPAVRPRPEPVLAVAARTPDPLAHGPVAPPAPDDRPAKPETPASLPKGPAADAMAQAGAVPSPSAPSFDADYLSNPAPEYPPISRMRHEQGRVTLRVHVTAEGRPDAIQLHQSSGFERLDQAASEAVWLWRFIPARQGGTDTAGWVLVPIRFSLRS